MMKPATKSMLLMSIGIGLITANDAATKYLVLSHPIGQVMCLRQAATLLVIIPYLLYFNRWNMLRVVNWRGQLGRGAMFLFGSVFIVLGLGALPLATAVTMLFLSPIILVALSAPLLSERVGAHRWVAVLGGFAGVLIIMRPGGSAFEWALLLPLAGAFINALRDLLTRRLSRTETSLSILFWSNMVLMAGSALTAPFGWVSVSAAGTVWFIAAGAFNIGAHFFIIEALRVGEASVAAPIRYTALLWAALFGYLIWGELPGIWLWAGAAVIVASSLYMIRMEGRT